MERLQNELNNLGIENTEDNILELKNIFSRAVALCNKHTKDGIESSDLFGSAYSLADQFLSGFDSRIEAFEYANDSRSTILKFISTAACMYMENILNNKSGCSFMESIIDIITNKNRKITSVIISKSGKMSLATNSYLTDELIKFREGDITNEKINVLVSKIILSNEFISRTK